MNQACPGPQRLNHNFSSNSPIGFVPREDANPLQTTAYLAVRNDLHRVRAVGMATSAGKDETTAEITIALK
jgi:hypothetical protein